MPVLLLLFLTLACLPERWPTPPSWINLRNSILLTWLGVLVEVLFAALITLRVQRRLRQGKLSHDNVLRHYLRGRRWHMLGLFVTYGLALYVFRFGWAVHTLWTRNDVVLPGAELLLLSPFFASLLLSWACFYSAEKAFWLDSSPEPARPFFTRRGFVWFHLRQNLALVFLPIVLLMGEKELRRLFPDLNQSWQTQASIAGVVVALTVFVTMPWILRLVLGLQPLPAGPLRDRLMKTARRLHFRCNDILVWNTRSGVANAMVVGVCPFLRYVLFTDRLLDDLSTDEVEAVFGHEIGHVKHHHMLYYLGFLLMSMAVLGLVLMPYQAQLDEFFHLRDRTDLAVLPAVVALGLYIFLVFGFLSRRCERQADIFGCRAVSCGNLGCLGHADDEPLPPAQPVLCPTGVFTFIGALEKVAVLNGISREKPGFLQSWQHSTIARRVEFLRQLLHDPKAEGRFQWRIFMVKCGLFAVLGVVLLSQLL